MKNKFNELIIGSGGMNGLCYIGALEVIKKNYGFKNFKYLTGCSVGSLLCFLLNIGYSIDDIKNIATKLNFEEFYQPKLLNLINIGGFVEHKNIRNLLIAIISIKNLSNNITFLELYEKTHVKLTITGVNLSYNNCEYFNYINTPSMNIVDALLISMNIPILCAPFNYNGNNYIDGAVLDPFPHNYNKDTVKLNLIVHSEYENDFILNNDKNNKLYKENSILNVFFLIYYNYLKIFYKKKINNTIYIINEPEYNFKLDDNQKLKLFNLGKKKANLFFRKKINKSKKNYLLKKYFYLLKYLISIH